MDRKLLLFLVLAVTASGCVDNGFGGSSGEGLAIAEFGITDSHMTPGQQARINLILENHHTTEIEIEDISLYNTAFLEVEDESCTEPGTIEPASDGYAPRVQCTWTVTAPDEDGMQGLDSRSVTLQLNLEYNSELSNKDSPLPVEFRRLEDIDRRDGTSRTYSNGEVEVSVSHRTPVPEHGTLDFDIRSLGPGEVVSDYSMEYQPSTVFQNCPEVVEPTIGRSESFSCDMALDVDSQITRNIVFSTSYKYIKSPSLDVEVVNP